MEGFLSKMHGSVSLFNSGISTCYSSNGIILLFVLIFLILEIDMKLKISIQKKVVGLYFSNVHISTNIVLKNIKSRVAVGEIHVEGTVSQNFVVLVFIFLAKKRVTFYIYF